VSTPVRWLEKSDAAPDGATALLKAAAPPPDFSEVVQARLAAGVAKTAALPLVSPWASLVVKTALVAGVGGASGLAIVAMSREPTAPVTAPAPVASRQVVAAPIAPPVSVEQLPVLELPTAPPVAPKLKVDPRLAEAELLEKARSLVGSNPGAALKLTATHAREYPGGRLGAEADLIAAQALVAMGRLSDAKQRAKASLARYPSSLYARQLREIVAK